MTSIRDTVTSEVPHPSALPRLKKRRDFLRVAASGIRAASPGLVLQAGPQPADTPPAASHVGFTASKKVGNAVQRNRTKRRLRALAHQILQAGAQPGWDYVLIGRAATAERSWDQLCTDLRQALKRVDRQIT